MEEPTMYERLGGQVSIDAVVERFYDRVHADPRLAEFFDGIAVIDLEAHQQAFLASALGGPDDYVGRPIAVAHRGLGITDVDFDRIVDHLVDALAVSAVPAALIDEIHAAILPLRSDVTGPS